MEARQDSDSRRISADAPDHRDARGRGFACQVAMAFCLALFGWCVPATWWGFGPSGFTLLAFRPERGSHNSAQGNALG
jgi:hypothetical protein